MCLHLRVGAAFPHRTKPRGRKQSAEPGTLLLFRTEVGTREQRSHPDESKPGSPPATALGGDRRSCSSGRARRVSRAARAGAAAQTEGDVCWGPGRAARWPGAPGRPLEGAGGPGETALCPRLPDAHLCSASGRGGRGKPCTRHRVRVQERKAAPRDLAWSISWTVCVCSLVKRIVRRTLVSVDNALQLPNKSALGQQVGGH